MRTTFMKCKCFQTFILNFDFLIRTCSEITKFGIWREKCGARDQNFDSAQREFERFEINRESITGGTLNVQGIEQIVQDREMFEKEGVRDTEGPL